MCDATIYYSVTGNDTMRQKFIASVDKRYKDCFLNDEPSHWYHINYDGESPFAGASMHDCYAVPEDK